MTHPKPSFAQQVEDSGVECALQNQHSLPELGLTDLNAVNNFGLHLYKQGAEFAAIIAREEGKREMYELIDDFIAETSVIEANERVALLIYISKRLQRLGLLPKEGSDE
jgi:hypothetical protein